MPRIRWFEFNKYSGVAITGDEPVVINNPAMHMDRAVWLTSQLEAPKWGSTQGYDGAALSGGLLHNIAVLPKTMEQGDLFKLIRRVLDATAAGPAAATPEGSRNVFLARLAAAGWNITPDGVLRRADGRAVDGTVIRNELSPLDGRVPKSGPNYDKALAWAQSVSDLFSSTPEAKRAQMAFAAEWMARGRSDVELPVYQKYANMPRLDSPIGLPAAALPVEIDLAMAVYHSFSVNAPAPAAKALEAMSLASAPIDFATRLVRKLGTTKFGRWMDEPGDGSNRYDRTRQTVWGCDLWDKALTQRVLPRDL